MGGSAPGPAGGGSCCAAAGAGAGGAVRAGAAAVAAAVSAIGDGAASRSARASPLSAVGSSPDTSSSAITSPSLTRSPRPTLKLTIRPSAGDGTSMAALSVSSVISGSLAATSSPAETATSTTSTSLNSPRPGTRTWVASGMLQFGLLSLTSSYVAFIHGFMALNPLISANHKVTGSAFSVSISHFFIAPDTLPGSNRPSAARAESAAAAIYRASTSKWLRSAERPSLRPNPSVPSVI